MPCDVMVSVVAAEFDGVYTDVPRKLRRRLRLPCEVTLQKASGILFATSHVVALNGWLNVKTKMTGGVCGLPENACADMKNDPVPPLGLGCGLNPAGWACAPLASKAAPRPTRA